MPVKVLSWEPNHGLKCPLQWQECAVFLLLPFKKSVHATAKTPGHNYTTCIKDPLLLRAE